MFEAVLKLKIAITDSIQFYMCLFRLLAGNRVSKYNNTSIGVIKFNNTPNNNTSKELLI